MNYVLFLCLDDVIDIRAKLGLLLFCLLGFYVWITLLQLKLVYGLPATNADTQKSKLTSVKRPSSSDIIDLKYLLA